jgi:hypothetical protein
MATGAQFGPANGVWAEVNVHVDGVFDAWPGHRSILSLGWRMPPCS